MPEQGLSPAVDRHHRFDRRLQLHLDERQEPIRAAAVRRRAGPARRRIIEAAARLIERFVGGIADADNDAVRHARHLGAARLHGGCPGGRCERGVAVEQIENRKSEAGGVRGGTKTRMR